MGARDTLDRLTRSQASVDVKPPAGSTAADYEALIQRDKTVLMLTLVMGTGDRIALNYAYLTSVAFNLSGDLVLEFADHQVRIKGTDLDPVFNALISHTAARITQAPSAMVEASGPVIRSLVIEAVSAK